MSSGGNTIKTISPKNIDVNNFKIDKPKANERSTAQNLSYIGYMNNGSRNQFYVKSPRILMSSGGIPKEGQYYETDEKRAKSFKIPFNKSNDKEMEFYEGMLRIDEYLSSDDFKSEVLGLNAKQMSKIDYIPIVRSPVDNNDDDDADSDDEAAQARIAKKKKNLEQYGKSPDYMKAFFELDWTTKNVVVKIIVKDENGVP